MTDPTPLTEAGRALLEREMGERFTASNERRRVRRRSVGRLDDGRTKAFPVRPGDTAEMVRAIFDSYDPELVIGEQMLVAWCNHTVAGHEPEWCERPTSRMVWTARYPVESDAGEGTTG